jgi:hypothetical protein
MPRRQNKTVGAVPRRVGPGAYNLSSSLEEGAPAFSIGRSDRFAKVDREVLPPGPTKYMPMPIRRIAAPSFGTLKRKDNFETPKVGLSASIGPGYYKTEISPKQLRTSFTFRGRAKEAKRDPSPGPGDYDTTKQDQFRSRPRNARFDRTIRE